MSIYNNPFPYNHIISNQEKNIEPDYDKIDQLIIEFKNGNRDAGEELILKFTPYLTKFFKILKLGHIDYRDKDSYSFVSLFNNENIIYSVTKEIPSEDIFSELTLIFFILCDRYVPKKGVNFCGYIYNTFRFELARRISSLINDPLTYSVNIAFNEETNNESSYIEVLKEGELDDNWINGITCENIFSSLTKTQRLILKLYYIEKIGDSEIGKILGINRSTVCKYRRLSEEALKKRNDLDAKKENN